MGCIGIVIRFGNLLVFFSIFNMFSQNIFKSPHKFYIFLLDIYINGQKKRKQKKPRCAQDCPKGSFKGFEDDYESRT